MNKIFLISLMILILGGCTTTYHLYDDVYYNAKISQRSKPLIKDVHQNYETVSLNVNYIPLFHKPYRPTYVDWYIQDYIWFNNHWRLFNHYPFYSYSYYNRYLWSYYTPYNYWYYNSPIYYFNKPIKTTNHIGPRSTVGTRIAPNTNKETINTSKQRYTRPADTNTIQTPRNTSTRSYRPPEPNKSVDRYAPKPTTRTPDRNISTPTRNTNQPRNTTPNIQRSNPPSRSGNSGVRQSTPRSTQPSRSGSTSNPRRN